MRYIACLAFVIFLITGCVKYPDGGNNASYIDGPYAITEMDVNGIDSTAHLFANHPACDSYNWFVFYKNTITDGCDTIPVTNWTRSVDKKQITVMCTPVPGARSLYPFIQNKDFSMVWDIQRLTGEDFWIKTTYNGKEYYIKFAYQH